MRSPTGEVIFGSFYRAHLKNRWVAKVILYEKGTTQGLPSSQHWV
jgi:hypothetical protein